MNQSLAISYEGAGSMGMSSKTDISIHRLEAPPSMRGLDHIMPAIGLVGCRMHELSIPYRLDQRKSIQPLSRCIRQYFFCPFHGLLCMPGEVHRRCFPYGREIMIARNDPIRFFEDPANAFIGLGTVAHEVSQANDAFSVFGIHGVEDSVQCFCIAVDVRKDGDSHDCSLIRLSSHRRYTEARSLGASGRRPTVYRNAKNEPRTPYLLLMMELFHF